ncbi:MAG: preprotein translocase subunit SecG [Flavobacteriia bacterium]|nr:preprotein translocase subunit SecG [Flavobacteriia bacterium]NDH89711.1 preprotein translocase subunit SecG [Flavobacteriia bacterium]
MTYLFMSLIAIVSILLILVVLVQNPKGGGLSGAFGGSSSTMMGGVKRTNDFLEKATWTLAIALLVLVIAVNVVNPSQGSEALPDSQVNEEIDNAAPTFQAPIQQQAPVTDLPEAAE